MQMKYISYNSANRTSLLQRAVAVVGMAALAGVALMFSAVLLVLVLIALMVGGAIVWWKTRALRRQMREQMKNYPPSYANMERDVFRGEAFKGEVIEGEAVRVDAKRDTP